MTTEQTSRLTVTFIDHEWRVSLDGCRIEHLLAPDGLAIKATSPGSVPQCVVELTFADVDLDADLRDVLVQAMQAVDRPVRSPS